MDSKDNESLAGRTQNRFLEQSQQTLRSIELVPSIDLFKGIFADTEFVDVPRYDVDANRLELDARSAEKVEN